MILLIPLGAADVAKRKPYVTVGLIVLCLVVFVATGGGVDRDNARELGEAQQVAGWILEKAAARDEAIARLQTRYNNPFDYFLSEKGYEASLSKDDREALTRCLATYKRIRARDRIVRYGFVPNRFRLSRLVTHQFMHADFLHIGFHMLFLWVAGSILEAGLGHGLFAAVYLLSGVAAALAHAFTHPFSSEPAIGASGAIAGIMGALVVRHAKTPIRIACVASLSLAPRISIHDIPCLPLVLLWVAQQVFLTLLTANMKVDIAFAAHLGGFAFGLLAGLSTHLLMNRREA